jgi:integrase
MAKDKAARIAALHAEIARLESTDEEPKPGNRKGWRAANGEGCWTVRHWPEGHPKRYTRDGRLAIRLHVYRTTVDAPDGARVEVQAAGKTKAIALGHFDAKVKTLRETASQIIGGTAITSATPYGDWFPVWMAAHGAGLSPASRVAYERQGKRHVVTAIGHIPLGLLTAHHIDQLLARKKEEGLAPNTVGIIRAVVRASLRAAHEKLPHDVLPDDRVYTAVDPIAIIKGHEKPTYTREEAAKLQKAARDGMHPLLRRIYPLILLGFATGGRRNELLGLQHPDLEDDLLNFKRKIGYGKIVDGEPPVEPFLKGNKPGRVAPLTPGVLAALKEIQSQQALERIAWEAAGKTWDARGWIVCRDGGRPMPPETAREGWRMAIAAAKVPEYTIHAMRHSVNEWLREAGVDTRTRADLLGHTEDVNENVYTRTRVDLMRQAAIRRGDVE